MGIVGPLRWRSLSRPFRVLLAVVVASGVLAALALLGWKFYVPSHRPGLEAGERYGIDVSSHQGIIDWTAVASDDVAFAYVKASEGGDFVDVRFEANLRDAQRAGLKVGAYHFFTFCRSGQDQAENFLRVAPPDPTMLPPAVDVEFAGNCAERPSATELENELRTFAATVERSWNRPLLLYVLPDVERKYGIQQSVMEGSERARWTRRLFRRPSRKNWSIWQVSAWAKVRGVAGGVDLNVGAAGF